MIQAGLECSVESSEDNRTGRTINSPDCETIANPHLPISGDSGGEGKVITSWGANRLWSNDSAEGAAHEVNTPNFITNTVVNHVVNPNTALR